MQSLSLTTLAEEQLALARQASSGRSAHTVHGGTGHRLRQVLMALTDGNGLAEHQAPGEATLQVLRGRVRLTAGDEAWEGGEGEHLVIPAGRHSVDALADSVILLTVVAGQ